MSLQVNFDFWQTLVGETILLNKVPIKPNIYPWENIYSEDYDFCQKLF